MSAPPIGMISSPPSTSAMMVISQKSRALPETTRATMKNTSAKPMPSAGGCAASVVATAIPMPIMPKKLPWRDDAGLDRPRSDRMKRMPATRYKTAARLAFIWRPPLSSSPRGVRRSLGFLLVHREHAQGDQEATEDIHAGKSQRNEAETARPYSAAADQRYADRKQRTDHNHRGD